MSFSRGRTMAKPCPITRKHFQEHAKPIEVNINGVPLIAEVKEFSTGSLGWNISNKMSINVGGAGQRASRPQSHHRRQQGVAEGIARPNPSRPTKRGACASFC